jgi:Domain of unknown function (DUF4272)
VDPPRASTRPRLKFFKKEKTLPDAAAVMTRALVLERVARFAFAMPSRDQLAQAMGAQTDAERDEFRKEGEAMRDRFWNVPGPLREALTPRERSFARKTVATLTEQEQVNAIWRMEALAAIIWALGIADLPPYDEPAGEGTLDLMKPYFRAVAISKAALRERAEIERAREVAELWHWRCRTWQLTREGIAPPADSAIRSAAIAGVADIVRSAATRALDEGTLAAVIDGDFPAFGKPFRTLDSDEWACVRSIAAERHYAFNWLCGYAPSNAWDDTPTET